MTIRDECNPSEHLSYAYANVFAAARGFGRSHNLRIRPRATRRQQARTGERTARRWSRLPET
jgi:hypothetical protein